MCFAQPVSFPVTTGTWRTGSEPTILAQPEPGATTFLGDGDEQHGKCRECVVKVWFIWRPKHVLECLPHGRLFN